MTNEPAADATITDVVVREIEIAASPETVWEFLVDPEKVVRWMGVAADFDPRPGGRRWLDIHGGRDIADGEHTAVDPPRHLGFTWGWEGNDRVPPGSSTVDVYLTSEGGGTRVRLEHRGLPGAEERAHHAEGWMYHLGRLAVAATGGDPGPDGSGA